MTEDLPAMEEAVVERVETGWLIEENAGGIIHWIALSDERLPSMAIRRREISVYDVEDYSSPVRRVKDAGEALRFARKKDADAFVTMFDRFLLHPTITEHQWPALASISNPVERAGVDGWRTIESAPKDEELWFGYFGENAGWFGYMWKGHAFQWEGMPKPLVTGSTIAPTHWRQLPAPPATAPADTSVAEVGAQARSSVSGSNGEHGGRDV